MQKVDINYLRSLLNKYPVYTEQDKIKCYVEQKNGTYYACDNSSGDAYVENFKTLIGVYAYLELDYELEECIEFDNFVYRNGEDKFYKLYFMQFDILHNNVGQMLKKFSSQLSMYAGYHTGYNNDSRLCNILLEDFDNLSKGILNEIIMLSYPTANSYKIKNYYNAKIDILNLSVRSKNCLLRRGIDTVDKLLDFFDGNENNLLKIRNLGVGCKNEIIDALIQSGLYSEVSHG